MRKKFPMSYMELIEEVSEIRPRDFAKALGYTPSNYNYHKQNNTFKLIDLPIIIKVSGLDAVRVYRILLRARKESYGYYGASE